MRELMERMIGMEGRLTDKLANTDNMVGRLEKRMDESDQNLPNNVMKIVAPEFDKMRAELKEACVGKTVDPKQVEKYWLARRSLRLWPVKGQDLRRSLSQFMVKILDFPESFLNTMGQVTIKPIPNIVVAGKKGRSIDGEVLV